MNYGLVDWNFFMLNYGLLPSLPNCMLFFSRIRSLHLQHHLEAHPQQEPEEAACRKEPRQCQDQVPTQLFMNSVY